MMALNRKLGAASVMTATQLLTGILSAQSPTVSSCSTTISSR